MNTNTKLKLEPSASREVSALQGLQDRILTELKAEQKRNEGMYLVQGGQPSNIPYISDLEIKLIKEHSAIQYAIETIRMFLTERV